MRSGMDRARVAKSLAVLLHPVTVGFVPSVYAAVEHEGGLTARLMGITVLVVPIEIPMSMFVFDIPLMALLAIACLPIFFSGGRISRIEGAIMLAIWMAYTVLLYVGWPAKSLGSDTDSSIQPPPSTTRSQ